jgi:trk system potassium uptake protein TrkH
MLSPAPEARPRIMQRAEQMPGSGGGRPAAWVAAAAPAAVPVLLAIHDVDANAAAAWAWMLRALAVLVAVSLVAGAQLLTRRVRLARGLLASGALGFGALGVLGLAAAPLASFVVALVTVALVTVVPARDRAEPAHGRRPRERARAAAWAALAVMLGLAAFDLGREPLTRIAGLVPALVALYEGRALLRSRGRWRVLAVLAGVVAATVLLWDLPGLALLAATGLPVGLLLLLPDAPTGHKPLLDLWLAALIGHPARLLITTFTVVGVTGGVALTLPSASTQAPLTIVDGLFMAFSAVCVTGLAVIDVPVVMTGVGEAILLVLIQVGGLGILTFTTAAFLVMGNLDVRSEGIAARMFATETPRASLGPALRRVLLVTAIAELLGALILSWAFVAGGESLGSAIWRGTFTSISAYCNAGFALQSDSLIPYQAQPVVVSTVTALIIVGGLGPAVVVAFPAWLSGRPTSLTVRLVITSTLWLLLAPTVLFTIIEWDHSLAGLGPVDRVLNAWFLSVTTRTAGFNSVDMTALAPATVTLVILLMAVGGSPGSTAGGIKTTTAAVLFLASLATSRGAPNVEIGRRTIPEGTVRRALATTGAYMVAAACMLVFIQLTQPISPTLALFEVVSALSTVGLSLGATTELDEVGRLAITLTMLVGRVGALTFLGVLMPLAPARPIQRPEEDIPIG